ncbi:MAG: ABC transporter substrate-binding protein [Saccharofermentanales bacterium]
MKNRSKKHMKNHLSIVLIAAIMAMTALASGCKAQPKAQTVLLGTTTSVQDSGLLEYLRPFILADTGITMDIVAQGSGQVLKNAQNGDFDLVLTHSPADEKTLTDSGKGIERKEFMYNFFVIVGPANDPAVIQNTTDAPSALKKIVDSGKKFISRGDESGTNKKELKLFGTAGVDTKKLSAQVYVNAGKGMGDVLNMASETGAYTLTDKATFLSMKSSLNLSILFESDSTLKNTYSIILVNPASFQNVNKDGARLLYDWFLSAKGLDLISKYGDKEYGEKLFYLMD